MARAALALTWLIACTAGLAADKSEVVLFDGKSLAGWHSGTDASIDDVWDVHDGMIHCIGKKGPSLLSDGTYADFDLSFDWKVAPGGNSGFKYRVATFGKKTLGCEYQLLDDAGHKNGKVPETSAGALYGLYAPKADKHLNPAGEWNHTRIVVRDTHFEHWLNGEKVVDVDSTSDDFKARVAKSKFGETDGFASGRDGLLMLQNHNSEAWFKNFKLKTL
jgi:hypothetical protein